MYKKYIYLIIIVNIFCFLLIPANVFAMFEQNFSLPIEGGSQYAKTINDYFGQFVGSSTYQSLLKAGFLLALLLTIFKFGFNFSEPWRDFLAYVMGFLLIVMPLPGAGKSLPILLLDSLDSLTNSIIVKLGHAPYSAGQGIMFMMMDNYASNYASKTIWHEAGKDGLSLCYKNYVETQKRNGNPVKPINKMTAEDWQQAGVSNILNIEFQDVFPTVRPKYCAELYQTVASKFKKAYQDGIDKYIESAKNMGVSINQTINGKTLAERAAEMKAAVSNRSDSEIVSHAVEYAEKNPEPTKPGFGDVLKAIYKTFTTSYGIQSLLLILPRLLIALSGIMALWFFDYYVYHIGILIKTLAAIGLAIGVLYYAFLKKFDMIIASMGAWMWANGTYILASVLMAKYWDNVDGGLGSIILFVLGQPSPLTDALFMLGMSFAFYSTLTGLVTWRGIGLSLHLPSAAAAATPLIAAGRSIIRNVGGGGSSSAGKK